MFQKHTLRTLAHLGGLSLILLISGCSGQKVHKARTALIDKTSAQVISCAGVPNKTATIGADEKVLEWDYDENKISGSLSMTAIGAVVSPLVALPAGLLTGNAFSISGAGNCKAVATFSDDVLIALKFSGDNTTIFSGKDGVCEPLFRGCLE